MWEDGPIPDELRAFPGYLLARLGDASRRRFHRALEPEGLHPRHFGVMNMVAAQPGVSQQQLHEQTGIDPSSMVAAIDALERHGLAERRPHPDDRRARAIYLTAAGTQKLKRVRALAGRLQRELFAPLTEQERETFIDLLAKLAAGMPPTKLAAAELPAADGTGAGRRSDQRAAVEANGAPAAEAPAAPLGAATARRRKA
jgi:DNA-binding MarR family transcriptional regulator